MNGGGGERVRNQDYSGCQSLCWPIEVHQRLSSNCTWEKNSEEKSHESVGDCQRLSHQLSDLQLEGHDIWPQKRPVYQCKGSDISDIEGHVRPDRWHVPILNESDYHYHSKTG